MLRLPQSPALREMFDAAALAEPSKLPTYAVAVHQMRKLVVGNAQVRSAQALCFRANGEIHLIQCGAAGGIKKLFNFGDPTKGPEQFKKGRS